MTETRTMTRLVIPAILVFAAATGCSSTSTTSSTGATLATTSSSAKASVVATPSASETVSAETTPSQTSAAESLGEDIGAKIGFYAIAKAAGMDDSAKMDQLAEGVCSRIDSGKQNTVGAWLEDSFQLTGDVAAKVAIAAITFQCPEYQSRVGS